MKLFQINEDDLASLESNLALIYSDGMDWDRFNSRADLSEAWQMVMQTLSQVRFNYGPPTNVHRIEPEEKP